MDLLKDVSAAVGVGNLDVAVECEEELHPGDQVQGVATITGGEVPQIVQGLVLTLSYRWPVRDEAGQQEDEGSKVVHEATAPLQIEVAPGSVHRVPFVFDIPLDAPFAEPGDWHSIDVRADIPHAIDVTGSRRIKLLPSRAIVDALGAVTATGGWALEGYDPRKAREGFVRAVLAPKAAMAKLFDHAYLEMAPDKGGLQVHATLDLKERFWKELTGQDKHHYSFAAKDAAAVAARFQELVDKHSIRP